MSESNQNSVKYYLSKKKTSKKTLVLDLDETLVHSQFTPFSIKSDLIIKIDLENQLHDIHVLIRPGVPEFLKKMAKLYEIVIFTASVSKYADPLLDIIDRNHSCSCRLFREHCSMVGITYIKDLKKLGRELKDIVIVDNSPLSYSFNPENGLPILAWFDDRNDKELYKITPILEFLSGVYDVREYVKQIVINNSISYDHALNVINSYSKLKHDDFSRKYIEEIITNNAKYSNYNEEEKNDFNTDEINNIINVNNYIREKYKKNNYVNITISNNAINNFLYFSPIYNINNNQNNNISNKENISDNYNNINNNNIEIKINPKFKAKENNNLHTKTNRTKSKEILEKININTNAKKKQKNKNKSNNYRKIKYISNNNVHKSLKDKVNSVGNKSYLTDINNSKSKDYNLNSNNYLELKTIAPGKKTSLIKDFKLPKTPEIEEILYPLHERILNNINNKKSFINLNKKILQTNRRGNSSDKNKNDKYHFRNSFNKFNNQIKPNSIINHEKHKSFNYFTPFHFEKNSGNSLKNNKLNNYVFLEPIHTHSCKNNSHSNHKYIHNIKRNKKNSKNISLNFINKNLLGLNECSKQPKNVNKKPKLNLISNNHKKTLSNHFKIIGISEYNKTNKNKKLINYNLLLQNSNSNSINNSNYKKMNSTNRTITTDNSYNSSFSNYNKILYNSNYRTINNNNLNRTNQLISNKKLFNNTIIRNSLIKYQTNSNYFFNYDNYISHKKTLSYNGGEIEFYKTIRRTNSSSISKNKNNLKEKNISHKDICMNNTNAINKKNKRIIKSTKRDIKDAINKKGNNKIARIKEIKFIHTYGNIMQKNNNNKNDINSNMIYNIINNNNSLKKPKKTVKN